MLQYTPLCSRELLGHGATVAQQTLDLFILVRVRMPQPEITVSSSIVYKEEPKLFGSGEGPKESVQKIWKLQRRYG